MASTPSQPLYVDLMKAPCWGQPTYILRGAAPLGPPYRPPQVAPDLGRRPSTHGPLFLAAVGRPPPTYATRSASSPGPGDDGHLDICSGAPGGVIQGDALLPRCSRAATARCPQVSFVRHPQGGRSSCDRPWSCGPNGEPVAASPLVVEILPRALKVAAPA